MFGNNPVHQVIRLVHYLGTAVGFKFGSRGKVKTCVHRIVFTVIILFYLFGSVVVFSSCIPIPPQNGTAPFRFSYSFVYSFVWEVALWYGVITYVSLFRGLRHLQRDGRFFGNCQRLTSGFVHCPEFKLRSWYKRILLIAFILVVEILLIVVFLIITAFDVLRAPRDIESCQHWLRLPNWACGTVGNSSLLLILLHGAFGSVFASGFCNLFSLYIVCFCDQIEREEPRNFTTGTISKYQNGYTQLVDLVSELDRMLRTSYLAGACALTAGACFYLYAFAKGVDTLTNAVFMIGFALNLFTCFASVAWPGIRLNSRLTKPQEALRSWFVRYSDDCASSNTAPNLASLAMFQNFLQFIISESTGVTVGSIAKLSVNLLLTLGSLVLTYFVVIVQFETAGSAESSQKL